MNLDPKNQTTWPLPSSDHSPAHLFSKRKRRDIVSALKACRKYLWDGKNTKPIEANIHICHALIDSGRVANESVRKIIEARLGDVSTVQKWLCATCFNRSTVLNSKQVQAYRLRWVNSLIEEFSVNYTPEQRQGIAEAFRQAKEFLWDGKGRYDTASKSAFICHALSLTEHPFHRTARGIVESRLHPHIHIGQYLSYGVGVLGNQRTAEQVQTFRREWLDHLIQEFSAP